MLFFSDDDMAGVETGRIVELDAALGALHNADGIENIDCGREAECSSERRGLEAIN